MSQITYPGYDLFGAGSVTETIPMQELPKVLHDLTRHFGIEANFSILDTLRPISDRVAEAKEKNQNHPAVQKRKRSELLYQENEETISEMTRKRDELEQKRLNDIEAGEQNLETLEELASIKTKLEILTEENRKLNNKVFDNLRHESHSYIQLSEVIRDAVYAERSGVRSDLLEKIEKIVKENSAIFAQFSAMDHHVDFKRITNDVNRGLNI